MVIVETLHYELLRAPNWAPEYMTVMRQQANNPTPFDQQVPVPDEKHGQAPQLARRSPCGTRTPSTTSCTIRSCTCPTRHTPCSPSVTRIRTSMAGPPGRSAAAPDGSAFESLSVRLTLHDSTEVERMGLGVRQMLRLLAPAINESPVLAMLDDASSSHSIRTFVDQLSETGHELAIIGFGAKGWCGMCLDQLRNATFRAWLRDEVAYATSRGVTLSAYTLMQLNGWGESVPYEYRTLNRDGTRGPTACFATDFHAEYRKEVLDFVVDVGLGGIETDGQFEGLACADESHGHHHNGLAGGWAAQLQVTLDFNRALKARGLYQTGADGYVFSGAQRYNHADTDAFGRLPLWERSTVGRLYVYDSTMTRLPTSGQINVGDLVSAVSAPAATAGAAGPCDEHGGRLRCLDFALMALASVAGQPYIHASRLYDPDDPDARAIATILARWTAFYKRYRNPRPSGAPGLLAAKMLHLLRPSARDAEAAVHLTADSSDPARALVAVINPTRRQLTKRLTVPLWYAGLAPGTKVRVHALNATAAWNSAGPAAPRRSTASTCEDGRRRWRCSRRHGADACARRRRGCRIY